MKKEIKRITLIFCIICGFSLSVFAESFNIKGVVTDESGEPLIGVTVIVKGTSSGTVTDVDGRFSLSVTKDAMLVFSFVGYESQEIKITSDKELKIVLKESSHALDEVVVLGYGTSKKMSIVGSASTVVAEKTSKRSKKEKKSKVSDAAGELTISSMDVVGYTDDDIYIRGTDASLTGIKSGTLTASEVNDFAKWDQWKSILTDHFSQFLNTWKYRPLDRYMVQLTNKQGMPIVDAQVSLQDEFGFTIWQARTDNTGKAELWSDIFLVEKSQINKFKLVFNYDGKKAEIAEAIPFSKEINSLQLDVPCKALKNVDVFFIGDATGSMSDEIRYLQVEMNDIIERVKADEPNFNWRVGSSVYRDHGDEYLVRKSSLDSEIEKSITFIKQQRADGGGDYPEAVDEALFQSITEEEWSEDALARIAFLFMDAPSHSEPEVVARLAEQIRIAAQKGVRIVPVACSGMQKDGEYLMRCIALATNGTYVFLTDDSGVGGSHIKPTTDKFDVERLNEAIIRIVKQYTQMPDCANDQWVEESKKESPTDKYVPNPYDEKPEEGVADLNVTDVMTIYPNPCRDILQVKVEKEIDDLYFVDMSGKSIFGYKPKKGNTIDIGVQNLATGIYFVKAYCKGKWFAEKIIVAK